MSVRLAKTAGFCMGVKRAVDMVLDIAQRKGRENIYTYGPLIHNPQTVELLRKRGIMPVDHIEELKPGDRGATLIIRAHGISPEERERIKGKGVRIVDATCPKVAHVQAIIKKYALQGYTIVIAGDAGHPEVNGLLGYAGGKGIVIGSSSDVDVLPDTDKVCVVAQTTQSNDDYARIAERIKERFSGAIVFDTICDSTEKRQAEVRELAAEMDAVLIVGGLNSANTGRLARLSELQGAPTFRIETADELEGMAIDSFARVGVSAGASTPNWIIDRVVDTIVSRQGGKRGRFNGLYNLWVSAVKSDIYSAIGAGCLCLVSILLQALPINPRSIATASLYVYAMHILNRFLDRKMSGIIGSFREEAYRKHERLYVSTALISLIGALVLSFRAGSIPFLLLLAISALGILYNTKIFPHGWRFQRLKDLPGSKNISMALAWAFVVVVLPRMEFSLSLTPATAVAFFFTFSIVFIRSVMSDTLDIQSDRLLGRETIPVVIGEPLSRTLLLATSVAIFALLSLAYPFGWTGPLSFFLLSCVIYVWICFRICGKRAAFSGVVREGLLETIYIIAGVMALLWMVTTGWTA